MKKLEKGQQRLPTCWGPGPGRRGGRSWAGMVWGRGGGGRSNNSLQFLEGQLQRQQSPTLLVGMDHTTWGNKYQSMEGHV